MSLYYDGKGSDGCLGGCYFWASESTAQKNVVGEKRDIIFFRAKNSKRKLRLFCLSGWSLIFQTRLNSKWQKNIRVSKSHVLRGCRLRVSHFHSPRTIGTREIFLRDLFFELAKKYLARPFRKHHSILCDPSLEKFGPCLHEYSRAWNPNETGSLLC